MSDETARGAGGAADAAPPSPSAPPPPAPPGDEPERDQGFLSEMGRLFVIPAVIVGLSVIVFVLFGLISSEGRTAREYLDEIRGGASNRRWQAAFEMSRILARDTRARSDPKLGADIAALLVDPKTEDPQVRRYLLLALQEIHDPATAPAVRQALSDPDPEVRLFAARALGEIKAPGSVEALIPVLQSDDAALRKMALFALGRLGDAAAVPEILPRLEDPQEDVRWNAALTLALLGDSHGVPILRQMLDASYLDRVEGITETQKTEARINAVQAAWRLRDPQLREAVDRLSRSDPSLQVRDIALKALRDWS